MLDKVFVTLPKAAFVNVALYYISFHMLHPWNWLPNSSISVSLWINRTFLSFFDGISSLTSNMYFGITYLLGSDCIIHISNVIHITSSVSLDHVLQPIQTFLPIQRK